MTELTPAELAIKYFNAVVEARPGRLAGGTFTPEEISIQRRPMAIALDAFLDEVLLVHFVPDYDHEYTLSFVDDPTLWTRPWFTNAIIDDVTAIPNILLCAVLMKSSISQHKLPFNTTTDNKRFFSIFSTLYAPLIIGRYDSDGKDQIAKAKDLVATLGDVVLIHPETTAAACETKEDLTTGGYVTHSSYKMMRLRMLITGTSGPTEEELAEGLDRLLDHLDKNPLPPKA